MDANVPIAEHAQLRKLMGEFGWEDAAECQKARDGLDIKGTFSKGCEFDDEQKLTRIDCILLNKEAKAMFSKYWVTDDPELQHRQLHIRLDAGVYDAPVAMMKPKQPYPVDERLEMTENDEEALARIVYEGAEKGI